MADEITTPPGSSIGDIVVALNQANRNASLLVQTLQQWIAPGQTNSTTLSPQATIVTSIATASMSAIGSSYSRRGMMFFNPIANGVNLWVVPSSATATINQGVLIVPGGSFSIPATLSSSAAWKVIAASGTGSVLTVLEFF